MEYLYNVFVGFGASEKLAEVASFFVYEIAYLSIILLVGITFFTFIRLKYLDESFAEKLNKQPKAIVYLGMALLGVVSPFCSCSTIPVFISFSTLGIPTGALFVYLITSPMVQEASFLLLLTQFGLPITIIYVVLGILAGIISGIFISKVDDREIFNQDIINKRSGNNVVNSDNDNKEVSLCCGDSDKEVSSCCGDSNGDSNKEETSTSCCGGDSSCDNNIEASNLKRAFNSSIETLKSMFKYIVMGIGVGAFVHGFVPEEVIQSLLGEGNPIAPIMATLVGIPIYADDVALIPIAKTLVDGGAGLGTALAFVMSSSVVSIPSFIMLGSVLKKQTLVKLAIYLSIAIIIIGYIFNFVAPIVL